MRELKLVRAGDPVSAADHNAVVEELRRLQNIKGGRGIEVKHTSSGVEIDTIKRFLTTDDKYLLDQMYNQSDLIQRLCDRKLGDLADFLRIRACIGESPRDELNQLYRAMLMLDRTYGGGERGGEGGWHTDAGLTGLGLTKGDAAHQIATPIRRIGQLGDVLLLDEGDFIAVTRDGDTWCFMNIRQDAHFYMSHDRDGRIYFTTTPAGVEPNGFPVKGEMVHDPAVADHVLSQLKKESGEWRPQWYLPSYDVPGEVYEPLDVAYRFPPSVRIPNSTIIAYEFGASGLKEGWSGHYQIQYKLPTYGLGYLIKYSAENLTGSTQFAFMENYWKTANDGGDLSIAGLVASNFYLPVPAGSTETDVHYLWVGFIPEASVSDFSLAIIGLFARDPSDVGDTLTNRLLITEVKMLPMIVVVPP